MRTAAATVAADEAAIDNASCRSNTAPIRAPVTGYAGRIQIQQGNLVKANDTNSMVRSSRVPSIRRFSVPEQNVADFAGIRRRRAQSGGELRQRRHPPIGAALLRRQRGHATPGRSS